jgi:hypothetical protein
MKQLGFNAIAPRDKFYGGGVKPSTPSDELGPGTYDTAPPMQYRPSCAPFNSTSGTST